MPYRILCVDDDAQTTSGLKRLLERKGYVVREENDAARALATAQDFQPDVVILDYLMPKMHGGDVAWQLASNPLLRKTRVIICSAQSQAEFIHKLPPAPIPIVEKPVETGKLLALIEQSVGGAEVQA